MRRSATAFSVLVLAAAAAASASGVANAQATAMIISGHTPLCLDVTGANRNAGAFVGTFFCNGSPAQQFNKDGSGRIHVYGNGSNLCLNAAGSRPANGDRLIIWPCNDGANEKFSFNGNRLIGIAGRCVGIKDGWKWILGTVVMWTCLPNAPEQTWAALGVTGPQFSFGGNVLADLTRYFPLRNAAVGNAAFTMPIGNNLANVTPLVNAAPFR